MAIAHWLDYVIFFAILLISLVIGIFFSCSQTNREEYLFGRRQMSLFPVSLSLMVSFVSAITMQGVPAEVYVYGIQYVVTLFSVYGMALAAATFVPLYYPLQLSSVYQYLFDRFGNKPLIVLAYALGICTANIFMGIILFGPAAALESATGIPTWINILGMTIVCSFYTSIGGMKAVLWNDAFQAIIMLAGLIAIITCGMIKIGGPQTIWEELEKRGRTEFNFSPDPTIRITVWTPLMAGLSQWGMYGNQPAMMRYEALPTMRKAKIAVFIGCTSHVIIQILAITTGMVVFAYYSQTGCEPLATGDIYTINQIVPYFLLDALNIPGISGLFMASVVAATLSSISSMQNALAAITYQEIVSPFIGEVSDLKETCILKMMVVFYGGVSMAIAFASRYIGGTLLQLAMLLISITDAPPIGMFALGACFTFTSGPATLIASICTMVVYLLFHVIRVIMGTTSWSPPLMDENCPVVNWTNAGFNDSMPSVTSHFNSTVEVTTYIANIAPQDDWSILNISPYLYGSIGIILTVLFGVCLSLLPCLRQKSLVSPKHIFPGIREFVKTDTLQSDGKNINYHEVTTTLLNGTNEKQNESEFLTSL